jgi:hypothetical protein
MLSVPPEAGLMSEKTVVMLSATNTRGCCHVV